MSSRWTSCWRTGSASPGFGFTGNLTLLDQKSSGSAPAFATGVPPMSYNVTGYYDHDGISVRLSYVFNDKTYDSGSNQQSLCLPNTTRQSGLPAGRLPVQQGLWPGGILQQVRLSSLFGEIPTDPELTFDVTEPVQFQAALLRSMFPNAAHNYYNPGQVIMFGVRGTW